jgi:hypothetical protein
VQVRLLGPVDAVLDGVPRPVNGVRRKTVLAALALHWPVALARMMVHTVVDPDFTMMFPVGMPPAAGVTVAVSVSVCSLPNRTGETDSFRPVVVGCWAKTVSVCDGDDVEGAKNWLPSNLAVS